jgi:hypothetical protein
VSSSINDTDAISNIVVVVVVVVIVVLTIVLPITAANGDLNYATSLRFCPNGSYCCGTNSTLTAECCNEQKGWPVIMFQNSAVIPGASSALSSYYAGLHVSTARVLISTISTSTSSTLSTSAIATSTTSIPLRTVTVYPKHGLSTGAKAGIGVGVSLGVIALVLVGALLFLRRDGPKREPEMTAHELEDPSRLPSQYIQPYDIPPVPTPPPRPNSVIKENVQPELPPTRVEFEAD